LAPTHDDPPAEPGAPNPHHAGEFAGHARKGGRRNRHRNRPESSRVRARKFRRMELTTRAAGMAQVVARRWSSVSALDPRTGISSRETIVQTIPTFVYSLYSPCIDIRLPEYPLVIFSRCLQQVPSDATAFCIMYFARNERWVIVNSAMKRTSHRPESRAGVTFWPVR
jgi:hypothetical protein